jgi:hypothetical protein
MTAGGGHETPWSVRIAYGNTLKEWVDLTSLCKDETHLVLESLRAGPPFHSPDVGMLRGPIARTGLGEQRWYYRITSTWTIEFVIDNERRVITMTRVYCLVTDGVTP